MESTLIFSSNIPVSNHYLIPFMLQAMALIGKEEGIKGYWKGNLPQVLLILQFLDYSQSLVHFLLFFSRRLDVFELHLFVFLNFI